MKIVILGGSGLIGTKLGARLREAGHEVVSASLSTGVNILTGEGVAQALEGAEVVVDVTNSPSFADDAVMEFFQTAARKVLPLERAAGVRHHVALSVVGAERLQGSGYMRAKLAQEEALRASGVPYTLVRATQFFEFLGAVAEYGAGPEGVRIPATMMQPIAAQDVADALADIATQPATGTTIELGGPARIRLDALVRDLFRVRGDARRLVVEPGTDYFGASVDDGSLVAGPDARLGSTTFDAWLAGEGRSRARAVANTPVTSAS